MKSDTGNIISESTFSKIISGLNETIGLVLEYLQDAKVNHIPSHLPQLLNPLLYSHSCLCRTMDREKEMIFLLQCGLLGGIFPSLYPLFFYIIDNAILFKVAYLFKKPSPMG